jgi:hypothetical protein
MLIHCLLVEEKKVKVKKKKIYFRCSLILNYHNNAALTPTTSGCNKIKRWKINSLNRRWKLTLLYPAFKFIATYTNIYTCRTRESI